MNTPDPVLQSILRQMSMETGMSLSIIHPGPLRGTQADDAFAGLPDSQLDKLRTGEASLAMETDNAILEVDRQITCAAISSVARAGISGVWAAFFNPDGSVELALPRSGITQLRLAQAA